MKGIMSGDDFQEYDELLHAYLDGELTGGQETKLREALAQNAGLRAKLKDFQALRSEARSYYSDLGPSSTLTGSVFAGLGLRRFTTASNPAAKNPPAQHDAFSSSPAAGGKPIPVAPARPWPAIAGSLVMLALVTAVVGILLNEPGTKRPVAQPEGRENTVAHPSGSEGHSEGRGFAGGKSQSRPPDGDALSQSRQINENPSALETARPLRNSTDAGAHSGGAERAAISGGVLATTQESPHQAVTDAASSGDVKNLPSNSSRAENLVAALREPASGAVVEEKRLPAPQDASITAAGPGRTASNAIPDSMKTPEWNPPVPPAHPTGPFSLQVRRFGIAARGFPAVNAEATPNAPMYDNIGIALYYAFDAQHALGIETGVETFSQQYDGMADGIPQSIQQRYRTSWLAARYKYNFGPFLGDAGLYPYMTAGAGATREWWPIVRLGGGVRYRVWQNLSLQAGLDASMLFYQFDGVLFSSGNAGGTAGITVGF